MLDQVPSGQPCILNLHCPPYASGLDDAPELDDTLKPVIRGGRPSIIPVGSHAVRDAIKRYQPVVGLHGHIHESRGAQKIGRTLCVNPGVKDIDVAVPLDPGEAARVQARLEALRGYLEAEPKTMKWRLRSQVGDKVRWYQQPEEEQGERP